MANYIVTYDLNGPTPSHKQIDDHLSRVGANRGRVLETVWWVDYSGSAEQLFAYLQTIIRQEDSLLVLAVSVAAWQNLLVDGQAFKAAFEKAA
ncbi:MAG: hypothetical protein R3197_00225 [Paracoccaceae bacterium]|nr:hypothetical protein [Paracoccaceae bacterium]